MSRRNLMLLGTAVAVPVAVAIVLLVACNKTPKVSEAPPGVAGDDLPKVPAGEPMFEDKTEGSGVNFTYRNGEESRHMAILESLGGGAALLDYDGDGLLDLFCPGGGHFDMSDAEFRPIYDAFDVERRANPKAKLGKKPTVLGHPGKLFRNKGKFQFEDVTDRAGLDKQPNVYTHGAAAGDYDRDGWTDLLVTGYGRLTLYHNESDGKNGRKFVDVTEKAGLLGPDAKKLSEESGHPGEHFWSTSAAWGDLDGDGFPDLYVCQYVDWSFAKKHPKCSGYSTKVERDVCPPKSFDSVPHALWHNKGNGMFANVTKEAGLRVQHPEKDHGKGLGVLLIDVNADMRPDIYVCNDTTDNFLYLNVSKPGRLKFEDKGLALGVARDNNGVPNGSMGVDGADYDGCGRPSIFVTNYESEFHALYRSNFFNNRLSFNFNTPAAGLSVIGPNFVGFGTKFLDVDNDGWEDIVIANGHVVYYPARDNLKQKPILFMNMEYATKAASVRRFADGTARGGSYFAEGHRGRGLAVGDLDNDGRPDLVSVASNAPVRIVRNVAATGNGWLGVQLRPKDRNDAVGTRLTLQVGERRLVRYVKGGASYLSAHDARVMFGTGEAKKVGKLKVEWSSGEPRVQELDALEVGKYHVVEQK